MLYAAFLFLLVDGPYLALTAVGIVLFMRHRNVPTALVAAGFGSISLGQIFDLFVTFESTRIFNSGGDLAAAVATLRSWTWVVTRYATVIGLWAAAVGISWYVFGRAGASPNNRWRGP